MRIAAINTKGGVGKSTVAVQLISPYLYLKNKQKKLNMFEFDDENEDSITFENSKILNPKRIRISGTDLDSAITNAVIDNEYLVFDIGGNKTTTYVLQSLEKTGMIDFFDLIIIPIMDGEQDAINAIITHDKIKEMNKNIHVIFVLNRIDRNMELEIQFLDFYGDTKGRIDNRKGLINAIPNPNIMKLYNSDCIRYSRAFGQTIFELSQNNIDEMQKKLQEAVKNKEIMKAKKISYRITILNQAVKYQNDVINQCFTQIDNLLKAQK